MIVILLCFHRIRVCSASGQTGTYIPPSILVLQILFYVEFKWYQRKNISQRIFLFHGNFLIDRFQRYLWFLYVYAYFFYFFCVSYDMTLKLILAPEICCVIKIESPFMLIQFIHMTKI